MFEKRFLSNSPTLFNAGTRLGQLSACLVLPIEDTLAENEDGILIIAQKAALIFQTDGAIGINNSKLKGISGQIYRGLFSTKPHILVYNPHTYYEPENNYVLSSKFSMYDKGYKYCSRCSEAYLTQSEHCPICGRKMRIKGRSSGREEEVKRIDVEGYM